MLDWLRQQLLFDPRIPTPLGWGVCQRLLSLDISKKVHYFYGDSHNKRVVGLTMLAVDDFVSCNQH